MTIVRLWLLSIEKKSVLFSRNFPLNECKARKYGFSLLPKYLDENEFVNAIFAVLGLSSSRVLNDDFDEENDNENCRIPFDCTLVNQLPVVEVKLKETSLWPVLIVEQSSILFCCLSLVDNNSREIVDHTSISLSLSAIQALVNHFAKSGSLNSIEEFITECMPFGTYLGTIDRPKSELSNVGKSEDSIVIKINERISSGAKDAEVVFGNVVIQNKAKMNEKATLFLNVKNLDSLNVMLSPDCCKIPESKTIQVKLNQLFPKSIQYKCNSVAAEKLPFITYNYSIIRTQKNHYKVNLSLDLKKYSNLKLSHFSVNFRNIFTDGSARVSDSTVNCGQLQPVKLSGLHWIIGSKIPKVGRLNLICDLITTNDSLSFSEAVCNFKIDNFSLGFEKLSADCITNNEYITPNYKLLIDYTFSSFNYKLIPNFE